ncbi:branched-chain amino acid ABC transporter ATP-binding protein [Bacillus sp. M6-12]|uniref:ABC transporter ATP-binding protein n=1 Tax=Bacillus sp. M6-12 TaxID=2054166 RepID=UPI000C763003|nr:ABC transporter ATP-binding protein [Bacillus sp. M6-12]PLS14589.1 branched-chain amino acid ABC transporter ATP-binding protein [Bacillus sp. M6-12]
MLEVKNLQAGYGEVQVLWDVNFSVKPGQLIALIGANAAGKSTTINVISGVQPKKSGEIYFHNKRIDQLESNKIVDLGIIQVPEGRKLFPFLTIKENLELGAFSKRSRRNLRKNLDRIMGIFPDLKPKMHQHAGNLSGGQQQMVAIGRALMAEPEILMIDELSLGLSPLLTQNMLKVVKDINQELGTTILLVEQNVHLSLKIATYVYVMENGKIVLEGEPSLILEDDELKKSYLGL